MSDVNLFPNMAQRPTLRVLAVLEGSIVSGPAKNLFEFCRAARTLSTGTVVDLTLVTFHRSLSLDCSRNTDLIEAAQRADIVVERIPERFLFDVQVVARLRRLVEKLDPDMIQTHASKAHFLMRCSGLGKNRPWIAFHHGYTNTDFRSPIYNNLDRWSLQAPDRVVTVSLATKEQLLRRGISGQRITVVHNAVPMQSLRQTKMTLRRAAKEDRVGLAPARNLFYVPGVFRKRRRRSTWCLRSISLKSSVLTWPCA